MVRTACPGGGHAMGRREERARRTEEASVAGESPDRSKQGEQASEPALTATSRPSTATAATTAAAEGITSRNAGSVPAAVPDRPEGARDPRDRQDPRVAVALAPGGGGSEEAEEAEDPVGPEEPEGPEDSAGPKEPEDSAGLEAAEESVGSEEAEDREGPEGPVDPVDPVDGDREDAESSGEEPDGDSSEGSERDSEDSDKGSAREGAAGEKEVAGDARLRNAVAAWVANANDADADDTAAEDGTGDKESADSRSGSGSGSGSEEPDAEASESEDAEERVTEEEASAPAEKPDPRVGKPVEQKPAAEEKPAAPESSVRDEDDEEGEDEEGPEAAKPEPAPEPEPESSKPEPKPEPEPSKPEPKPRPEPSKPEPPAAKPTVDQPTTAIRVVRPPNVDQPTTMLKLGGALPKDTPAPGRKDGPKDTPKPGAAKPTAPKPGAPTDAEKTSQFIALRPLPEDARRPLPDEARPKPSSDATTALPRIPADRTMQQPLPPKPPIDLLAELTNTPPPPATWWRVSLRRVKIYTPLAILLVIIFAIVQQMRTLPQPTLALTATDSHTFAGKQAQLPWPEKGQGWMDADGIGTIDHFGEQKPVPIGSVAKTMTAYIVLKDHPLKPGQEGPGIPVDALAEKEGGYDKDDESTLNNVKAGEKITEKQALSAIMIPSANNIARLLARWDAGSEAAFVKKMNETAKQLGMKNTTYTDPSGLKATTVSTAEDQVKLGNAVVDIPALVDITRQGSWTDPKGEVHYNYNHLIPNNNSIGIKTGTTTAAGGCLLFAGTRDVGGETTVVVGALLGQFAQSPTENNLDVVNDNSRTAMIAAQKALISETILKKGDVVGYVDDQLGGQTPVVVSKDVKAIGWSGKTVKLSFKADEIPHTAKAGTKVGTLTVGNGANGAVEVPVQLQGDLVEPGFGAKLTRIG